MIARMWESRVNPGQLDEFCRWVREVAWPQYSSSAGFAGGEMYRSDEENRAVIVTRWTDGDALAAGNSWFDLGVERFCAEQASAWQFVPELLD